MTIAEKYLVTLAVAVVALVAYMSNAHAEPVRGQGLVCMTHDNINSVFEFGFADGSASLDDSIKAVNEKGGHCAWLDVFYELGAKTGEIRNAEKRFNVYKIAVIAVCTGYLCRGNGDIPAFTLFENHDAPA